MTEFGLMNARSSRWVCLTGEGVIALGDRNPFSLLDGFPDDPNAGRQDFAVQLLDAIMSGNLPPDVRCEITDVEKRDLVVARFKNDRPQPNVHQLDIVEHVCANMCFDVIGPEDRVDLWCDFYVSRFPGPRFLTSAVTIDEASGMKTRRVWRKTTLPLAA